MNSHLVETKERKVQAFLSKILHLLFRNQTMGNWRQREEVKLPKGSEAGKGLFQSHSPLRFVTWAVTAVVEAIFTERERDRGFERIKGGGSDIFLMFFTGFALPWILSYLLVMYNWTQTNDQRTRLPSSSIPQKISSIVEWPFFLKI